MTEDDLLIHLQSKFPDERIAPLVPGVGVAVKRANSHHGLQIMVTDGGQLFSVQPTTGSTDVKAAGAKKTFGSVGALEGYLREFFISNDPA